MHRLLDLHGWLGWLADVRAASAPPSSRCGCSCRSPRSSARSTSIASRAAVERRHYPSLPPARGASIASQVWDAISIAARILLLNVLALIAALILPGVGLILAWIIGGYAIGRGLFAAVAMRRMPRPAAEALYRRARPAVLTQGCILALAATIPVLNLLIPVIGTAAMVHVLDQVLVAHADRCG